MADAVVPPNDQDAEESILGACMMSRRAIDATGEVVRPSDFYRQSHGLIYQAILDLHAADRPVDAITVADRLTEMGMLDQCGGTTRIHEIAVLTPSAGNARHYATIVRDAATLRGVLDAGKEIQQLARDRQGTAGEILERVEEITFALTRHRPTGPEFVDSETVMAETITRMEKLSHGGDIVGLPTGFTEIDRVTSGLHPGNLIVVAGRPSMGKSAFAFGVALNTAVQSGLPVAIFTFEMNRVEVAQRLISAESFVDASRVRSPSRLSPDDWKRVMAASARISAAPLVMDDTKTATMADVRSRCRRLKILRPNLALVIIDYLQLMGSGRDRVENRQQDLTAISRDLKLMASELDIPVLVLSQLSRTVEGRHDKRPILSDLRESGAIEQDADVVAMIYRGEYYFPEDTELQGLAEIDIAKQRNGPTGMRKVAFVDRYARFSDLRPDMA